ncbi:hypothetical protein [Gordonia crocea]|uniref:Uncharacterized protein n=1 Tax=Gordonia crocea TaxID=589162 RepID=A0A7M3SV69_9ACTN|nr:hypothetical protein [Gordonia crocea]GED96543.1 hypothetical protein nbrc107697_05820 [Gordonia crocea]
MQGLAAILFPLGLMLVALAMEKLENLAVRGSSAVSPDQVDSMLSNTRSVESDPPGVAEVSVLPTTVESPAEGRRRAS